MTPRNFLIRGLLAGLIAGILTFAVAYVAGEPSVDAAIAVETANSQTNTASAQASHHEVSRQNQSTWGLLTATVATSLALGGITALAAAAAMGRLGRLRPSQSTALVAALAFVSVALVPFLKYPATPPAVGNPGTINDRTIQYFLMLAISLAAMIAAVLLVRALLIRLGTYTAVIIGAAAYLSVLVLSGHLMPTVDEIGAFPGDTLWYFRRGSLLTLATLWGVIGIALTGLIGKLYEQQSDRQARRDLAASL